MNEELTRRGFCSGVLGAAATSAFGAVLPEGPTLSGEIDFDAGCGRLKRLNGINNAMMTLGNQGKQVVETWQKMLSGMNLPSLRLHDCVAFCRRPYVDVSQIFPLYCAKADPSDPGNYFFWPTDDYLDIVEKCGGADMDLVYRLGESAEWTYPKRIFAHSPRDWNQYTEVCAGILRHNLDGWGGGKKRKIRYWEIWNEPDLNGKTFWERPIEDFYPFYCQVAKRPKREFDRPDVLIGGPAFSNYKPEIFEAFLKYIAKENAPLDFFTFHTYLKDWDLSWPDRPIDLRGLKAMLEKYGYGKAEIHINEWRYFPCPNWTVCRSREGQKRWNGTARDGFHGIEAAAMTARCLTKWSDEPLDMANFYGAQGDTWSCFAGHMLTPRYRPEAYPLDWFGALRKQFPNRVKAASSDGTMTVLASKGPDGSSAGFGALVSVFRAAAGAAPRLALKGMPAEGKVRVRFLQNEKPPKELDLAVTGGVLNLPACDGSAVYFIEFKK